MSVSPHPDAVPDDVDLVFNNSSAIFTTWNWLISQLSDEEGKLACKMVCMDVINAKTVSTLIRSNALQQLKQKEIRYTEGLKRCCRYGKFWFVPNNAEVWNRKSGLPRKWLRKRRVCISLYK